jgi:hypothetical protein
MTAIYVFMYVVLILPMFILADTQSKYSIIEYLGNRFNYFSRKSRQISMLIRRKIFQMI